MTEQMSAGGSFEGARELERAIAEGLWAIRPQDKPWDSFAYVYMETGGTGGAIAKLYRDGLELERARPRKDVLVSAMKLREVTYQPGKGAWLSMTLTITPTGDGWETSYNYTDKPDWELGDPGPSAYAQELYLFPRDEDHIPDWFKEEMKGATWTPDSD